MRVGQFGTRRRRFASAATGMTVGAMLLALSACSSSGASGSSGATSASGTSASGSGTGNTSASSACGTVKQGALDGPASVLDTLPADLRAQYAGYPADAGQVVVSKWSAFAGVKAPWKIGVLLGGADLPWDQEFITAVKTNAQTAQAAGKLAGSVEFLDQPTTATATVAQQIAQYHALVQAGVNGIIMNPLSPSAMVGPVEAAAKLGIPTVVVGGAVTSPYAINVYPNTTVQTATESAYILKQLHGQGNVILVEGVPGTAANTDYMKGIQEALANCPGIHVEGTVNGGYSDAQAKSGLLEFLASHPQPVAAVLQVGITDGGIIKAFQQVGRPVPLIDMNSAEVSGLAYWNEHKSTYNTLGNIGAGLDQGDAAWRVMLRVLAGNGVKLSSLAVPFPWVTNDNVGQYVPNGATVNTAGDAISPLGTYGPASMLDEFFTKPGTGLE